VLEEPPWGRDRFVSHDVPPPREPGTDPNMQEDFALATYGLWLNSPECQPDNDPSEEFDLAGERSWLLRQN